jgi:TRAP-type C4-dicarboxylate transport system permease small subunit
VLPAFAQDPIKVFNPPGKLTFWDLANRLSGVGNTIITFLVGVAFIAIIWGAFKYLRAAGDSEKIAEGRKVLVYGIIALFLMLSFWGFVMIIKNSLFG